MSTLARTMTLYEASSTERSSKNLQAPARRRASANRRRGRSPRATVQAVAHGAS